ncbi:MAG: sugar-binding protein [Planctomycetota bacterium]|jgi:hypothetical protein|nr:sugar-binding protein [Planctomycetota bacterium]
MLTCFTRTASLCIIAFSLPCGPIAADDTKSPYYHAPFDGERAATIAGREVGPLEDAKYTYEDGPVGKAIVIGEDAVVFKEEPDFPMKKGTLAFWLKPHWLPEFKNHWIFKKWTDWQRSPVNGFWCLSGGKKSAITMGISDSGKGGRRGGQTLAWRFISEDGKSEWAAGTWKHFAFAWGQEGVYLYVNGSLVDINDQCNPPDAHSEKFYLGGKHNYYGGKISMDDLRIYDEALDRHAVRSLFEMGAPAFRTAPPLRQGVLEEAVVAQEFSRIYGELYAESRRGAARSPVEFALGVRKRFERYLEKQKRFEEAEEQVMRRRLESMLRNVLGVPRAEKAPTLDGRVTEAEWGDAAQVKGFWRHKSSKRVWRDTTVRIAYDREYLYLGAVLQEYAGDKVIATFRERDGKIWRNDAIEIFIQAQPDEEKSYYHFIVNALGACFDRKNSDASWNSSIKIGAEYGERDDEWSVELALPFSDLGVSPSRGTLIRANIARENVDKDIFAWKHKGVLEVSSWTPVPTRLNDPDTFGVLILE